ncbi:hypothetical protein Btru_064966 [Bulinus truncatus]|nr:hypothetical protein Btru_064966 [Bulinus truncatus]
MKTPVSSYGNFRKGDIIEIRTETETYYGIYVEFDRIVHAECDVENKVYRFLLNLLPHLFNRSTVKIHRIEDLIQQGSLRKNNSRDSFWNTPSSPDEISERALQEIGYRTHRNSLQFAQHCRYGSEKKLVLWAIIASVTISLLCQPVVQSTVQQFIVKYQHFLFAYIFLSMLVCLILSICCGPNEVLTEKRNIHNKGSLQRVKKFGEEIISSVIKLTNDVFDLSEKINQEKLRKILENDMDSLKSIFERFKIAMMDICTEDQKMVQNIDNTTIDENKGIQWKMIMFGHQHDEPINVENFLKMIQKPYDQIALKENDAANSFERKSETIEPCVPHTSLQDEREITKSTTTGTNSEGQPLDCGVSKLNTHYVRCRKSPCHEKFIPVDTFNLNHLPDGHRDHDLYELIKATADLTVIVAVTKVSPNRPELWFDKKEPYPFYKNKDSEIRRQGSGKINRVEKFTCGYDKDGYRHLKQYTECWCKKCQNSELASPMWWEFNVVTATHVVFDDIEANHTSLRLFYDRDDSPLVSVDQITVDSANIKNDWCRLRCVTCDKNLGDKLFMLCQHCHTLQHKVYHKYRHSRDVDKVSFIVSHPHGCSKQVSIGHWLDKQPVDDDLTKFSYNTFTCPGSAGAPVQCLGYFGDQHIHSGCLNGKVNFSGAGFDI